MENSAAIRGSVESVKHLVKVETSDMFLKRIETEVKKGETREPLR